MDVSGREKTSGEWGKVCACRRGHSGVCVCAQEEQSEHMAEDKAPLSAEGLEVSRWNTLKLQHHLSLFFKVTMAVTSLPPGLPLGPRGA